MAPKTLLVVSGGIEAVPGIRRARELGLFVVVSDKDPEAPGFALADDCLLASTYDAEATTAVALRYHREVRPLDGVICVAADVPLTVASVAAALGLPGIAPDAARLATDKVAMKQALARHGVPIPWFAEVDSPAHLQALVAEQGLPLVIKPVDSRGARGVQMLAAGMDLALAYEQARVHSATGRVVLERYLDGPQVSTESLMIDGVAYTPGFSDRNYEYLQRFAPHIIENGGDLPSHLTDAQQDAIKAAVAHGALAMGIRNGVIKGDMVMHQGRPHIIELAARLSGGYFCTHEIPLNTGVDLVGAAIRQCLGEPVNGAELQPRYQRGVAQRYIFPQPGVVRAVQVPDWITTDPDIALCEIRTQVGALVGPIEHHPARAGVVIATGVDRQAAIRKAEAAVAAIRIETTS
jgi:biotin carboxylase